ncbi:MAG: FixH family protein [Chitinophagales bacterium]
MNWGNRLLITFIVFGTGIFYLVYRSLHTNFELVEKDYYKSELRYQDVIDGSNRVNALGGTVKLEQTSEGVVLKLPDEMKDQDISGNVLFYCEYNEKQDRKFALIMNTGTQVFEKGQIDPGSYTVKISWTTNDKNYYTEKIVIII